MRTVKVRIAFTSPRLRGEVGARRLRVRGLRASRTCRRRPLTPTLQERASLVSIPQAGEGAANTIVHTSASRPHLREVCHRPSARLRAQGMPGARRARSLACKNKKHASIVTTVTPDTPGIPRAMVLTVSFVLSPVTGLSCHRRPRGACFPDLTPASGRQDHTTSPSAVIAFVESAARVHRIPLRVRDDRETPLVSERDRESIKLFLAGGEAEYFSWRDWTGFSLQRPSGKSSFETALRASPG